MNVSFPGRKFHVQNAPLHPSDLFWVRILKVYHKLKPRKLILCEVLHTLGANAYLIACRLENPLFFTMVDFCPNFEILMFRT